MFNLFKKKSNFFTFTKKQEEILDDIRKVMRKFDYCEAIITREEFKNLTKEEYEKIDELKQCTFRTFEEICLLFNYIKYTNDEIIKNDFINRILFTLLKFINKVIYRKEKTIIENLIKEKKYENNHNSLKEINEICNKYYDKELDIINS